MNDYFLDRPTPGVLTIAVDREQWRTNRGRARLAVVLLLAAGAVAGLWASVDRTADGDPSAARGLFILYAVVLGPCLALLWGLLWVRRIDSGLSSVVIVPPEEVRAVERRLGLGESGHAGLGFRYSRPLAWFLVAGAAAWAAPGWYFVEWGSRGGVVAFAVVMVLFFATPLITVLRRGFRRGVLILTPDRVLHRSWGLDSWVPWDEAVYGWVSAPGAPKGTLVLFPTERSGAKRYRLRTVWPSIAMRGRRPKGTVVMGYFGTHPVVVGESLRFYAENAKQRSELGTSSAVDRVRRAAAAAW